ncbi:MAG: hypothetical protein KAJ17_03605, partial [Candidatus Krumholzibacteria bacterium]|nr:hypothetical protein [Candidatus Krumholzibacteria bacterium]
MFLSHMLKRFQPTTALVGGLVGLMLVVMPYGNGWASDWVWQNPIPQGNTLRGVSFTDASTGTAVGDAGTILRTTNGGATWVGQTSGTTKTL